VALVTGAASGIGRAVAEAFHRDGAAVVATDVDPRVCDLFAGDDRVGIVADITDPAEVRRCVEEAVTRFGGLDLLVCNAGFFPESQSIEDTTDDHWQKSLDVNLTGHLVTLRAAAPFLQLGFSPAVVFVASKNVPAPGPGASAYSVAKAGMTQLARVAALELGPHGVRVNTVHPHAVFDTGAWDDDVIATRAGNYGITAEEYRTNNVLGVELVSDDVATVVTALASRDFSKTTGAQIPLDGGSDRVI
jgi:NAD(P)-dependent dehydrogenase (short-subunit alcohol dehydrogenase family)